MWSAVILFNPLPSPRYGLLGPETLSHSSILSLPSVCSEVPKVSDNVISVESPAVKEEFPEKGMTTLKKVG